MGCGAWCVGHGNMPGGYTVWDVGHDHDALGCIMGCIMRCMMGVGMGGGMGSHIGMDLAKHATSPGCDTEQGYEAPDECYEAPAAVRPQGR